MFLSGKLSKELNETVEIEDKYKIEQHGFDKWSFRKMPESKGKKKWKYYSNSWSGRYLTYQRGIP